VEKYLFKICFKLSVTKRIPKAGLPPSLGHFKGAEIRITRFIYYIALSLSQSFCLMKFS